MRMKNLIKAVSKRMMYQEIKRIPMVILRKKKKTILSSLFIEAPHMKNGVDPM